MSIEGHKTTQGARLVTLLNTHFKHIYTRFNTLFHLHVYQKHPKYLTQT